MAAKKKTVEPDPVDAVTARREDRGVALQVNGTDVVLSAQDARVLSRELQAILVEIS